MSMQKEYLPEKEEVERIFSCIKALGASIRPVWEKIHANPEKGFEEKIASSALAGWLQMQGFSLTIPAAGMETAFIAEAGGPGRPKAVFLAEYDALPGMGHACGHSLSGVASVLAAAALAAMNLPGTVAVMGTPAEEAVVPGAGGKLAFIAKGLFKDADAALMAHAYASTILKCAVLARCVLRAEWHGVAAHAGAAPHKGKNALTAAILGLNAVNALYPQFTKGCRINSIIRSGGTLVNTVPDYAAADLQLRAPTADQLEELMSRTYDCLKSGGLASGCSTSISLLSKPVKDLLSSEELLQVYAGALECLGVPFIMEKTDLCISTDAGNVSHELPFIHPFFSINSSDFPELHSLRFACECATEKAWTGMLHAACALALTGRAVLTSPELRTKMENSFAGTSLSSPVSSPQHGPK